MMLAKWDPIRDLLTDEGVDSIEESGTCCFAKQDKVWVDGPDGAWEIYTVLSDVEMPAGQVSVAEFPSFKTEKLSVV